MDVLHAYALLRDACRALDDVGEYAVAAYIGHSMYLLETKYDIDPDAIACNDLAQMIPPAKPHDGSGNWA